MQNQTTDVLKRVSAGEITWLCSALLVEVNGGLWEALRSITAAEMQPRARIEALSRCTEGSTGEVKGI